VIAGGDGRGDINPFPPSLFSQSSGWAGDISVGASSFSLSLSPGSLRAVGPDLETNSSPL
jgi:hypothetical protein